MQNPTSPKKKAVVSETPPEAVGHQVRMQPGKFNELIFDKGYEVYIDRALRCPCAVKGATQGLPSCSNCLGTGWMFIDRSETRLAVQGINADVKYENWSKLSTGLARITARAVDKLAFMDRIIVRECEGFYNEILRAKTINNQVIAFATYEILEIESIFMFISDKEKHQRIEPDDYTILDERIVFRPKYRTIKNPVFTVRYRHCLTYHIIDMNRDIMKVRTKDGCKMTNEELTNMPIAGTARKAHFMFDNLKFEEANNLIDNSKVV